MAIIRNTAAMRLRGRVGNTTYYTEGGRQIARVSQNSSNYGETARRTDAQQMQRAKWANLVNFYKASRDWMPKAYENKKRTQSDYNRFMQLNVASASVYLTKDMYAQGGCVVEPFKISEGSLRSVQVSQDGDIWVTDLRVGDLVISAATTVGELSQALIANNAHLHNGVQLSFISYQQQVTPTEVPQVICAAYELTLNTESSEIAQDFIPSFALGSVNGYIATDEYISTGAFAYVISDSTSGKTLVSTQTLINNNDILIGQYSSASARAASIASYGVDTDVFLMSGSAKQDAEPGTQYLAGLVHPVTLNPYPVGKDAVIGEDYTRGTDNTILIQMASVVSAPLNKITGELVMRAYADSTPDIIPLTAVGIDGKRIRFRYNDGSWRTKHIAEVSINIDGVVSIGNWAVPQPGGQE